MKKVGDGICPPEEQVWVGLESDTVSITPTVRDALHASHCAVKLRSAGSSCCSSHLATEALRYRTNFPTFVRGGPIRIVYQRSSVRTDFPSWRANSSRGMYSSSGELVRTAHLPRIHFKFTSSTQTRWLFLHTLRPFQEPRLRAARKEWLQARRYRDSRGAVSD